MTIVEIQFTPNGETARFMSPVDVDTGTRFVVPGASQDDPPRMGTVVAVHGEPQHGERLPGIIRMLAPGETWSG
jgi:hypothetical protein